MVYRMFKAVRTSAQIWSTTMARVGRMLIEQPACSNRLAKDRHGLSVNNKWTKMARTG